MRGSHRSIESRSGLQKGPYARLHTPIETISLCVANWQSQKERDVQHEAGVLDKVLDPDEERDSFPSVEQAVVVPVLRSSGSRSLKGQRWGRT